VLVLTDGGVESGPSRRSRGAWPTPNVQVHTRADRAPGQLAVPAEPRAMGRGRFYACPSRFEHARGALHGAETAPLSSLREGPCRSRRSRARRRAQALGGDTLPPIGAWNEATPRSGASAAAGRANGGSVLSAWDQGSGRVGVLLADLQLDAAAGLQRDPRYGAFLADLLRSLAPRQAGLGKRLELEAHDDALEVRVRGLAAREVTVTTAGGGRSATAPLVGSGPGLAVALVPWRDGTRSSSRPRPAGRAARRRVPAAAPRRARLGRDREAAHARPTRAAARSDRALAGRGRARGRGDAAALGGTPRARRAARVPARGARAPHPQAPTSAARRRRPGRRCLGHRPALLVLLPLPRRSGAGAGRPAAGADHARAPAEGPPDALLSDRSSTARSASRPCAPRGGPANALALLDQGRAEDRWPRVLLLEATGKLDAARKELEALLQDQSLRSPERAGMLVRAAELAFGPTTTRAAADAIACRGPGRGEPRADQAPRVAAGNYGRTELALRPRRAGPRARDGGPSRLLVGGHEPLEDAFLAWTRAAAGMTLEREKRHAWLRALEVRRSRASSRKRRRRVGHGRRPDPAGPRAAGAARAGPRRRRARDPREGDHRHRGDPRPAAAVDRGRQVEGGRAARAGAAREGPERRPAALLASAGPRRRRPEPRRPRR
jgi:hypothetical protein